MLVAVTLLYWAIMRAPALADRTDNPRLVEAELRIRRGRVLDANGVVLAETIGPQEDPLRYYPVPAIGPAVGYYSFRHGTSGIEQGYDDVLRGENCRYQTVPSKRWLAILGMIPTAWMSCSTTWWQTLRRLY
jgi:peptidoglycan glycosyltransferase